MYFALVITFYKTHTERDLRVMIDLEVPLSYSSSAHSRIGEFTSAQECCLTLI
jgi:hypothetical protein